MSIRNNKSIEQACLYMPLVGTSGVRAFFSFTSRSISRRRFLASHGEVLSSDMLFLFLIESDVVLNGSSSEISQLREAENTVRLYGGGAVLDCEAEDKVLRVSEVRNIAFATAGRRACDASKLARDIAVSEALLVATLRTAPCGSDHEVDRD